MHLVIVHYHLNRGGVTQVIVNQLRSLASQWDCGDIIDGITDKRPGRGNAYLHEERVRSAVAEREAEFAAKSPQQVGRLLKRMEKQMYEHARNLEFEEAARLRDEIQALRSGSLALVEAN